MTKLASALPQGGHGLESISERLVSKPKEKHVVIGVVDCSKVTTDHDNGSIEPVARVRRLELVHADDVAIAERLIRRGLDKRLGSTVLPISIEDDISEAFADADPGILEAGKNPDPDDDDQADYPELHDELRRAADQLRKGGLFRYGRASRILSLLADQVESGELPATAHHLLI